MSGKVVHFELPADDMERAQSFYHDAFGWQITPMPEMSYAMAVTTPTDEQGMPTEPGGINGGLTPRQGSVTSPTLTIGVDSVDEALAAVEKYGGRVVAGRQAVGDMGFVGYFADPEGNVVGLWENA
ncbi:VOC family protein [Phytohabitans rumicis]|uniref:Glyoxalase n=1 Tax=Phytohabitans rumicis TaxID=1076125 RepID=A0A6V8LCM5_9ACTN|nr:VOC family protein [Phytohabitans rumicis]GFJ91816.1 glyoxalase [Phytohabitans rumicis]